MNTTTTESTDTLAQAVNGAGLSVDPNFSDADLPAAPGPFVTMNIPGDEPGEIVACVALRDDLSASSDLLTTLAAAVAQAAGSTNAPVPAGPIGTGADLGLRFSMPVTATALTDGVEIKALIVNPLERRGDEGNATPEPPPHLGTVSAAAQAAAATAGGGSPLAARAGGLDKLVNVGLDVSVELGRTSVTLADVLGYDVGSIIELDRAAGAPVDVRVNGMLLAQGEVVLIDDEYAVRVTALFDPPTE